MITAKHAPVAAAQLHSGAEPFVRESRSLGHGGNPRYWRDTRGDLVRRSSLWRAALDAGGVTTSDRILVTLPAFWAVGCDCLLATLELGALSMASDGVAVDDVLQYAPTVLVTTPTEALRLAQAAATRAVDLTDAPLRLVVVTGEPGGSIASTRRRVQEHFGAQCLDVYALTEAGVVGWGCTAPGGIHLDEDEYGFVTLEPDSEATVRDGEVGELLITTRNERGMPLTRYRTGDLARLSGGRCECGSNAVRAEGGVLGRVSERLVVRGVEVLPATIEQVVRRHPAVAEYHLLVYLTRGECQLAIQIEPDDAIASESSRARVAAEVGEDLRRSLGLRLACDVVAPGSLLDHDAGRRARRLSRQ